MAKRRGFLAGEASRRDIALVVVGVLGGTGGEILVAHYLRGTAALIVGWSMLVVAAGIVVVGSVEFGRGRSKLKEAKFIKERSDDVGLVSRETTYTDGSQDTEVFSRVARASANAYPATVQITEPTFERHEHKTRSENVEVTEWEETRRGTDVEVEATAAGATTLTGIAAGKVQPQLLFHSLYMNLDANVDDEARSVQFWFRFESHTDEILAYRMVGGHVRVGNVLSETSSISTLSLVAPRSTSDYGWLWMQGVTKKALSDVEVHLVVHYGRPGGGPWVAMDYLIEPMQTAWFPDGWPNVWSWRQKREVTLAQVE